MAKIIIHDWNQLSIRHKNGLTERKPIFIVGPRTLSAARILELTEILGAKANLVWGCLKDDMIPGLKGPQFQSLRLSSLESALTGHLKRNKLSNKVEILHYYQRDWKFINQELKFAAVIFINGSWNRMLHLREEYWQVERSRTPYKLMSPFSSEKEARAYEHALAGEINALGNFDMRKIYTDEELLKLSLEVAAQSYDYVTQIGLVIARQGKILLTSHNQVVPYETYALHHGSVREKNFSPVNDQNHYDTCHAEIASIIKAQEQGINLNDTTLYINLLPCPSCARALALSEVKRIVYNHDHSDGYAVGLLEAAGKELDRVVLR